jgi:hypothetical protein
MNDTKFGSWSVAESPVTIEYSLVVLEEVRHEVAEGFQRLSRGGIEVGGVLYGVREGRTIRALAMRPMACEHARGPTFLLSDRDRQALHAQLLRDAEDPQLEGLISLGWFLSHTRTDVELTEADLELYTIFFPAPWQVTLVVRPGRGGTMRAGFFVRETDGTVRSDRSYLEFSFPDRLAGAIERLPERAPRERPLERPMRERPRRRGPGYNPADAQESAQADRDPSLFGADGNRGDGPGSGDLDAAGIAMDGPRLLPPTPQRRKWPLVVWGAVIAILIVLGLRYRMQASTPEPIALSVIERDGQLQIQWNRSAKPVREAARGSLEIDDGTEGKTIALTHDMLAAGNVTWTRKTGDVEVRLTVQTADGARSQEASRYLGPPPAAPQNPQALTELKRQKNDLEAEVERLRKEDERKADRIQQLERLLKLRLGTPDQGKQ